MENKYYVPEIEEFHVGFEFLVKNLHDNLVDEILRPEVMDEGRSLRIMSDWLKNDEIRVKHLDREDIESLGFIARREQHGDTRLYRLDLVKPLFPHHPELDTLYFAHYRYGARCILFLQKIKRFGIEEDRPETQLFNGYIKNKSELKRILKQIGV